MNMVTRLIPGFLILSAVVLIGPSANAQYTGPSTAPTYKSVAAVLKNPVDDAQVTLEGHIVKQVSKDKYIFSDGSGEITVEIDKKRLPAAPINAKTKVRIQGEVDKDVGRSPEIDVKSVAIIH